MMLPEGENELLLNEQQIQEFRESRKRVRWQSHLPRSLSALAIQSVVDHFTRFIDVPDCPLKYLPNTVVQQLLSKIHSTPMPDPLLMQLLGLLVNPNVTDLDCTGFRHSNDEKTAGNFLLKHALENCPNMRKIRVANMPKNNINCGSYSYHYQERLYVLPFECFKKSWNHLTTIVMSETDFWFEECAMQILQENFPNMEELHVCVYISSCSETLVNYFVKMKRLHTLYLPMVHRREDLDESNLEMIQFLVDVAGGVPNLRNFGFDNVELDGIFCTSKFIDLFGEKYPSKNIQLMEEVSIHEGLQKKWPKNLSVTCLTINVNNWSDTEIENLSTIDFMLDLAVNCLLEQTCKVLDCIGGRVKSLTIDDFIYILKEIKVQEYDTEFILERVLAACPNLVHFELESYNPLVRDPKYNLPPAAFKNFKSFRVRVWDRDYQDEVALQHVYRKFLIGTEVCESHGLRYFEQLETLVQVALEYPESLQQLRMLYIHIDSVWYKEMNDEECEKYCEYFYQLMMCCHKLERISFPVHKVTRMNRYLATIQSIDPHFIQEHT